MMAERDAAEAAEARGRVRARLRQQFEQETFTPFPWFDATRPYEFLLFTEEQMRTLNGWESRWTRPAISLEDFLRAVGSDAGPPTGKPASILFTAPSTPAGCDAPRGRADIR